MNKDEEKSSRDMIIVFAPVHTFTQSARGNG